MAMLLGGSARSRLPPLVGILASAVIIGVLLALLVVYLATDEPAYPSVATIATPSEIGARWHALFIAGGCATAALLLASQALQGCVEPAVWAAAPCVERALAVVAGVAGLVCCVTLVLFVIFAHGAVHIALVWVFFVCLALSLGCELALRWRRRARQRRSRPFAGAGGSWVVSASALAAAVVLIVAAAILDIVCAGGSLLGACNAVLSTAAVLQWVSLLFFAVSAVALGVNTLEEAPRAAAHGGASAS